jgi:hypothetical protein
VTHLIPHVWVQDTGFGPKVYAGQIIDSHGHIVTVPDASGHRYVPIRLAPLTPAGFDKLATQLADDIKAAAA